AVQQDAALQIESFHIVFPAALENGNMKHGEFEGFELEIGARMPPDYHLPSHLDKGNLVNDDAAFEDGHFVAGIGVDRRASKETLQPKVPWDSELGRTQVGYVMFLPGQAARILPVRE